MERGPLSAAMCLMELSACPTGSLFAQPPQLREGLRRALVALDDGTFETRGLRFVWHSLRHGGASRSRLLQRLSLPEFHTHELKMGVRCFTIINEVKRHS